MIKITLLALQVGLGTLNLDLFQQAQALISITSTFTQGVMLVRQRLDIFRELFSDVAMKDLFVNTLQICLFKNYFMMFTCEI